MVNMKDPWSMTADQVVQIIDSGYDGLASAVARQRQVEFGPNVLSARDREPWYLLFLQQFANPLVYILIVAALVKAFFKGPADALVIVGVLFFMAIIGFVQEMKAQKAMAALLQLSAPRARVRRDGVTMQLDAAQLVPGDLLVLEAGDRIAADGRLLEIANLRINESTFTGESLPVEKDLHVVHAEAPIHDRKNMVFMGTTVSQGRGLAIVTAIGMQTEIGRIAEAIRNVKKERTPLQKSVDRLGHMLIWVVIGTCAILAVAGLLQGMGWVDVMLLAVAAAVSGIPEGLPAAVTVVLAICVSRMAKRHVIIRKLAAVETLGTATIICSDKTGTLTLNQMTVREIWMNHRQLTVTGSGYDPVGNFEDAGIVIKPDADTQLMRLLRAIVLCNDAILHKSTQGWNILGDPTEGALLAVAAKAGLCRGELEEKQPRLDELPFESEQQFMATLHPEANQRMAYVKGSVEKVLTMCASFSTANGEQPLDAAARQAIIEANDSMAAQALRVLAVAVAPYPVELGKLSSAKLAGRLSFLGLVGMIDPPREEARQAIQACQAAGIRVAMITGDNPLTAAAIAAQLGIGKAGDTAMVGQKIAEMDDEQLLLNCRTHNVYARIEPLHKLRIVQAFQRDGHIAAMTGDGVNDAPALEAAGIGVAMGITGTDVAKEAADMVLTDDNFASIVAAVEEGRIVFNRLRNVTFFLLMTCCAELLTLFLSVALYGESPLEPIQILWINLVTGALVAIPLGLEPGIGNELLQPPRDPRVNLVYSGMLYRIGLIGCCMSLMVTWIFHHAPLPAGAGMEMAHKIHQSVAFTSIVIFEWLFAFQARSTDTGVLRLGLFRNPWLFGAMLLGIGLQAMVIYLPFANKIFRTQPLNMVELGWTLLPAVIMVTLEGLRKSLVPHLFDRGQWKLPPKQKRSQDKQSA